MEKVRRKFEDFLDKMGALNAFKQNVDNLNLGGLSYERFISSDMVADTLPLFCYTPLSGSEQKRDMSFGLIFQKNG